MFKRHTKERSGSQALRKSDMSQERVKKLLKKKQEKRNSRNNKIKETELTWK